MFCCGISKQDRASKICGRLRAAGEKPDQAVIFFQLFSGTAQRAKPVDIQILPEH